MKWYVCENRNGSSAFRCLASSSSAALRTAFHFDPSGDYVRVREAHESERVECERLKKEDSVNQEKSRV